MSDWRNPWKGFKGACAKKRRTILKGSTIEIRKLQEITRVQVEGSVRRSACRHRWNSSTLSLSLLQSSRKLYRAKLIVSHQRTTY